MHHDEPDRDDISLGAYPLCGISVVSICPYIGLSSPLLHRLTLSSSSLQGIAKASFLRSVDLSGNAYIEGTSRLRESSRVTGIEYLINRKEIKK